MLDSIINATKYFGLLWAAASGALALLTNFKDKETGKVTTWGKVALAGVVASAVLSIVAQTADTILKRQSAEHELHRLADDIARQEATLKGVETVLHQIERQNASIVDMRVSISFWFREDHPLAIDWIKEARPTLSRVIEAYEKDGVGYLKGNELFLTFGHKNGESWILDKIIFYKGNSIFPKWGFGITMGVAVLGTHQDGKDFQFGKTGSADIEFKLASENADGASLEYYPREQKIIISFSEKPASERATGRLISLKDLSGLCVAVGILSGLKKEETIEINDIAFMTRIGEALSIKGSQFTKFGNSWPDPTFIAKIPNG